MWYLKNTNSISDMKGNGMRVNDYKICHECGGVMLPQTVEKAFPIGNRILRMGELEVYVCSNCGEEVFLAKEICAVDRIARSVRCQI